MNRILVSGYTLYRVMLACLLVQASGCGTLPSGRGWGEDVSLTNWYQIKQAALSAAKDPETWAPLAGAAVFSMGELDESVSDWASKETPVFGSNRAAEDASDYLRGTLSLIKVGTALATPSGDTADEWLLLKFKGLAVMTVASAVPNEITDFIKQETDRRRPNDSNESSFPSGHATQAYASSTLASRNVDSLDLSEKSRRIMRYTFKGMAAGTAWARVEANLHFPSDVLFAAGLSHFLSAFIHDAFMGLDDDTVVSVTRERGGMSLQLGWRF